MKDYTKFMKWALVYMIDRKTQDDRRSKLVVEGLFSSPSQIEDNYIIRNAENKHYIISVDDLEEFEPYTTASRTCVKDMENMQPFVLKN